MKSIYRDNDSSIPKLETGISGFDVISEGGVPAGRVTLLAGTAGSGKTVFATQFLMEGVKAGQHGVFVTFEDAPAELRLNMRGFGWDLAAHEADRSISFVESRDQRVRNARSWNVDFEAMEAAGKLLSLSEYPHAYGLEDHLLRIRTAIEEFRPSRVAIDSVSALERISGVKEFREFVIGITSYLKLHEIAGVFTASTSSLAGGSSVTEAHISTITDSIILLRYVEFYGEMRRGITVLKMRGSAHDKQIREFTISERGMAIGEPFDSVYGILTGNLVHVNTPAGASADAAAQETAEP